MLALTLLFLLVDSARVSYDGQQVMKCSFHDPSIVARLQNDLDVWGVLPGNFVDVRVKHAKERALLESLDCQVMIPDLEANIQKFEAVHLAARSRASANASAFWFEAYHTYSELYTWYRDLASNNSRLVQFIDSIGTSAEGRQQPAIRIFNTLAPNRPRYRIYWQAQIHAREWISGATVNYIVDRIVDDFNAGDLFLTSFLNEFEILVVPFTNPDGYEYTWSNDRMWRKNRRNTGALCIGVDINRNYDDHWNEGGSSPQPCSETYMGPSAASEPETKNTQAFYIANQANGIPILGAIDWHSYTQLILRPYGYTNATCPDEALFAQVGQEMADIIYGIHGKNYTSQRSIQLYVTSGTASDWFYGEMATRGNSGYRTYAYTIELRPEGNPPGFVLPPEFIIPTGQENYAAIRHWLQFVRDNPVGGH